MDKKIIVMIFDADKAPKTTDWISALVFDETQHKEVYDKLCEIQN